MKVVPVGFLPVEVWGWAGSFWGDVNLSNDGEVVCLGWVFFWLCVAFEEGWKKVGTAEDIVRT